MATIRELYDTLTGKKKKKKDRDEDWREHPNRDLSAKEAARRMAEVNRKKRKQMDEAAR